ncbi:hypothetical protein Sango_2066700 [Sesamum angolense]|uniref:Uncharacterized protein n=1 Tax=Sesamum angolense TaxID=2727404 RepID=A0AAE2BLS2_9LAMI|nr:hypothetical protein Sango_2066700 [Sesamum angolense]
MQLGGIPLYGFIGELVHPRGMISLPLTLGTGPTRRTCMLKFLEVDVPSTYNIILRRPTLNAFQAIISIYHMKIKFPAPGGVEEVQGDPIQSHKCYIEVVRKRHKRNTDKALKEVPSCKRGKDDELEEEPEAGGECPLKSC